MVRGATVTGARLTLAGARVDLWVVRSRVAAGASLIRCGATSGSGGSAPDSHAIVPSRRHQHAGSHLAGFTLAPGDRARTCGIHPRTGSFALAPPGFTLAPGHSRSHPRDSPSHRVIRLAPADSPSHLRAPASHLRRLTPPRSVRRRRRGRWCRARMAIPPASTTGSDSFDARPGCGRCDAIASCRLRSAC